MPHLVTKIAVAYIVAVAVYSAYVPEEDFGIWVAPLWLIVPLTVVAMIVDKFWGTIKRLHPVVALAMAGLMVVFAAMAGQSIEDSMPYIVFLVLLAFPMLIISLCINFRGF